MPVIAKERCNGATLPPLKIGTKIGYVFVPISLQRKIEMSEDKNNIAAMYVSSLEEIQREVDMEAV
jgi:hypothetical protein